MKRLLSILILLVAVAALYRQLLAPDSRSLPVAKPAVTVASPSERIRAASPRPQISVPDLAADWTKADIQAWVEKDPLAAAAWLKSLQDQASDEESAAVHTRAVAAVRPAMQVALDALPPAAAAALLAKMSLGEMQNELTDRLLARWAPENIDAALDWAKARPPGSMQLRALLRLSDGWVEHAPADALAFALTLPEGGDALLQTLSLKLARHDPDTAAACLISLPEGPQKARMTEVLMAEFAKEAPEATARYVASLPPGDAQTQGAAAVASAWADRNPSAAADWAGQLPVGRTREHALVVVAWQWVHQEPTAAMSWLQRLPIGRDADTALNAAAGAMFDANPRLAALLADGIADDRMRQAQVSRAATAWLATDPAAATAWVAASDLPPEIKRNLRPGGS